MKCRGPAEGFASRLSVQWRSPGLSAASQGTSEGRQRSKRPVSPGGRVVGGALPQAQGFPRLRSADE